MCNYLNIICKFAFKLFYLNNLFRISMSRRSSNPQTPHPIWKEICPWSSISILTLSISCSVDFYPLTRDLNWNPELLLWRAGFVFLYNRSLPVSSFFETTWMWFLQNLVLISEPRGFLRPLFFECLGAHSQIQGMFPILILKFCFRNLFQGMLAICRLFFVRHLIQECQRRNCVKQNVGSVLKT